VVLSGTVAAAALIIAEMMLGESAGSADPPATPGPQPVLEAQLAGLLLSVDEVKRLANVPHDYEASDTTELRGAETEMRDLLTLPGCLPAVFGGSEDVYRDSGVAATVVRKFFVKWAGDSPDDPLPPDAVDFEERVVLFETPSAAKQQADRIVDLWRACAGNTLRFSDGTPIYRLGQVSSVPGNPEVFILRSTIHDAPAILTTEVAIAAKANVVVDITMSGFHLGDSIEAVTDGILGRIPE
jgi:hypothetical protein